MLLRGLDGIDVWLVGTRDRRCMRWMHPCCGVHDERNVRDLMRMMRMMIRNRNGLLIKQTRSRKKRYMQVVRREIESEMKTKAETARNVEMRDIPSLDDACDGFDGEQG